MSTMTGVVPAACPAGVIHTISLLLRLEEQWMKGVQKDIREKCYIYCKKLSKGIYKLCALILLYKFLKRIFLKDYFRGDSLTDSQKNTEATVQEKKKNLTSLLK